MGIGKAEKQQKILTILNWGFQREINTFKIKMLDLYIKKNVECLLIFSRVQHVFEGLLSVMIIFL